MNLLISQNLAALRRMHGYTLEQTAEKKISVTLAVLNRWTCKRTRGHGRWPCPLVPMKTHPSNLSCQPIRCSIGFQHTAACKAVADVVHFRRHLCGQRLIIRCVIRPAAHSQHD